MCVAILQFQQLLQLVQGLQFLQIRVTTNVLSIDEDVWHCALASEFSEIVLNLRTLLQSVQLQDVWLDTQLVESGKSSLTVWAVSLRSNKDRVGLDGVLNLRDDFLGDHFWIEFAINLLENGIRYED